MKKFVVFLLLTAIIFFPPISIFFASKTAGNLRREAYLKEQQKLVLQDFQILEKRQNFIARVAQELSSIKEQLSIIPAESLAEKSFLSSKLIEKTQEFCSRLDFAAEICAFYPAEDRFEIIRAGKNLDLMPIVEKFRSSEYFETFLLKESLPWLASGEDNFQRYMYRFAQLIKTKDVSQIVFSEARRRKTFLNTFITLTDKRKVAVFAIADLSEVNSFEALKTRLANYPERDYGIVAFDRSNNKIAFSNFFRKRSDKISAAKKAVRVATNFKNLKQLGKDRIYTEPKVSGSGFFLLALAPEKDRENSDSSIFIVIASIFSCLIFKVMVEKLYLQRGPDLNLNLLIPATFALLIVQPVFASIYLAEEFINTSYVADQTKKAKKLEEDLIEMDKASLDGFRARLNFVRSLDSIEKMEKIVGRTLGSTDIKEFFMHLAGKIARGNMNRKPVHFSSLWVYPHDKSSLAISRFFDDRLEYTEEKTPVSEIFSDRCYEKLDHLLKRKAKDNSSISVGELKLEFARDFFINLMGQNSFYKFRRNSDLFIDIHSFYRHDYFVSFPLLRNGRYFAIIAWHFSENVARECFPEQELSVDENTPQVILYGDEKKILSKPEAYPWLEKRFPDLIACAKEAHLSRSSVSQVISEKERSKSIKAVPLGFSLYTGAGYVWLQSFEIFKANIMRSIAILSTIFFFMGMLIAWSGAKYFTEPINRLTQATEEINKGNFSIQIEDKHPDEFSEIGSSFNKMARGLQEGKVLKNFVSGSVLKEVASGAERLAQSAEKAYATILFSGIRNFKELQNHKSAIEIFDLLQKHLTVATEAIGKFGGEIDKMIEDKIMIVFQHEDQNIENSRAAIMAALEIQQKMSENYCVEVSVGINSGLIISGIMGAEKARLAHTVVGDPVNLAARLAAEAMKMESSEIVVSGHLTSALPEKLRAEKLPISKVKGKTQSIEAYVLKRY